MLAVSTKTKRSGLCLEAFLITVLLAAGITSHAQTMFNVLATPTASTFVASSFIDDNEGWLADDMGVLWHTTDGGLSLDPVFTGKNFLKLNFANTLTGFALAEDDVFKTTDGGVSWEALQLGSQGLALWFLDDHTGFISSSNKIFKTIDGGETWTTIQTEIPSVTDFYFINETVGVACAIDREFYQSIWRTIDGGTTWTNVFHEPKYLIYSVWFVNENTGYAAGYYDQPGLGKLPAINKTTDGGLSWKNIYQDNGIVNWGETFLDIRFKNETEGFALANFSQSAFTTDGGLTWTSARETDTTGLPTEDAGIFKILDGYDDMFIVGTSGVVIKW